MRTTQSWARPIFLAGGAGLAITFLAGCDSYTAVKAIEFGASAMASNETKPVSTEMTYFQDAKTHLCFARADTTDASGTHAGASITQVECSPEVLSQAKSQP